MYYNNIGGYWDIVTSVPQQRQGVTEQIREVVYNHVGVYWDIVMGVLQQTSGDTATTSGEVTGTTCRSTATA